MLAITVEQRSIEWLQWKKNGVGASESGSIAAAIGLLPEPAPWMSTIQELWEYKTGLRPPKQINPGMIRGVLYEDDAVSAYENLTGLQTSPICGEMDGNPQVQASLDGITLDQQIILETKIPNQEVMDLAKSGSVVPYYQPQCAHQCLVTWGHPDLWPQNAQHHFYVYQPESKIGHLVAVEANKYKHLAASLLPAIQTFWKNVEEKIAPCGDAWLQAAIRYRIAAAAFEQAKAIESEAKEVLLAAFPKTVQKKYSGGGVTVTKSSISGKISYADYIKDLNIPEGSLEKYRGKPSSSVRLTVNDDAPIPKLSDAVKLALGI